MCIDRVNSLCLRSCIHTYFLQFNRINIFVAGCTELTNLLVLFKKQNCTGTWYINLTGQLRNDFPINKRQYIFIIFGQQTKYSQDET